MMTKERRAELEALADKDPHMCLLRELLNEIAELEARAVMVPPLPKPTGSRADAAVWGIPQDIEDVCIQAGNPVLAAYQAGIRRGHAIAENGAHAIPADRVLGDGMVAVDRAELEALQELLAQARCAAHAVEDNGECDMTGICSAVFACDSIRANQGGAAT